MNVIPNCLKKLLSEREIFCQMLRGGVVISVETREDEIERLIFLHYRNNHDLEKLSWKMAQIITDTNEVCFLISVYVKMENR